MRFRVLIATLLLAVSSPAPAGAAHILKVRAFGDPVTLDWNLATSWVEALFINNLMDGLVDIDSKLEPKPALAEKWVVSADRRVYTFHLRKGVKWSDGVPLKAQHFIDGWERLLSPAMASRYAWLLFDVQNAEDYNRGVVRDFSKVGVRAIDDQTLEVKLNAPISYWYWIASYTAAFPIRKDLIDKDAKHWLDPGKLVTLGPFVFESREPGKNIVFKRNPHYYGQKYGMMGNLDELRFLLMADDARALKLYETGEVDLLPKLSAFDRSRLRTSSDLKSWPDMRLVHLRMNVNRNPTAKTAFRRAIGMAINRKEFQSLFGGFYQPASSFVPQGIAGYSATAGLEYNPARAREELKKTGLEPATLPPLDLLTVGFSDQIILAQFIQRQLKENLGLKTKIHIFEQKRFYSPTLPHNDFALQINFWGADYPDADSFFSIFLGNSGLNRYKWKNAEYDKLVLDARSESGKKREKAYLEAQKILLENEVATIPLYWGSIAGLVRADVQGFDPGPLNWWFFRGLSVK